MQIKQLTTYAGPDGFHAAESIWECPQEKALSLIEGGYAVQIEAEVLAGETTAKQDAGETTAKVEKEETPEPARANEETTAKAGKKGFLSKGGGK